MAKTVVRKELRERIYFLFPRDEETEVRFIEMGFRPHRKLRRYGARAVPAVVYQSPETLKFTEIVVLKRSPHLNFLVLTCLQGDYALEYVKPKRFQVPLGKMRLRATFTPI